MQVRLSLERLEDRCVPSTVDFFLSGVSAAGQDVQYLAQNMTPGTVKVIGKPASPDFLVETAQDFSGGQFDPSAVPVVGTTWFAETILIKDNLNHVAQATAYFNLDLGNNTSLTTDLQQIGFFGAINQNDPNQNQGQFDLFEATI
jgi:hypothetical protein